MESSAASWVEVSRLMDAYATPNEIPDRVKTWRAEAGWSQEMLATKLRALADETNQREYQLPKAALFRIEHGERNVSVVEAVGLARVFGKSLAELILPTGSLEEADDWRLFETAAEALNQIQSASFEYEMAVGRLRARIKELPQLKAHIEREQKAIEARDAEHAQIVYARRAKSMQNPDLWPEGTPPILPFVEWMAQHLIAPAPDQIVAEHVLGKSEIDHSHWYLGWDTKHIETQALLRIQQINRDRAKES